MSAPGKDARTVLRRHEFVSTRTARRSTRSNSRVASNDRSCVFGTENRAGETPDGASYRLHSHQHFRLLRGGARSISNLRFSKHAGPVRVKSGNIWDHICTPVNARSPCTRFQCGSHLVCSSLAVRFWLIFWCGIVPSIMIHIIPRICFVLILFCNYSSFIHRWARSFT